MLKLPKNFSPAFGFPGQKPTVPTDIEEENTLGDGLLEFFIMQDRVGKLGNTLVSDNEAFTFPAVSTHGQELTILDTVAASEVLTGDFIPDSSPITILIRLHQNAAFSSEERVFVSNSDASAIIVRNTAATTWEFLINSLTNDRVSQSFTYNANEEIVVGGSWAGAGTALKVITSDETNGLLITTNGATSTGTYTNANQQLNNQSNMGTVAGFVYFATWDRELSEAEVRNFIDDPYQILKPSTNLVYFPVGVTPTGGIVRSLANSGGLAAKGGLAGQGGGLAA